MSEIELPLNTAKQTKDCVLCTKYPEGSKLKGTPILDFSKAPRQNPTIDDFFELYAKGVISEDILNRAILDL